MVIQNTVTTRLRHPKTNLKILWYENVVINKFCTKTFGEIPCTLVEKKI